MTEHRGNLWDYALTMYGLPPWYFQLRGKQWEEEVMALAQRRKHLAYTPWLMDMYGH
jgi:hypothetical protein